LETVKLNSKGGNRKMKKDYESPYKKAYWGSKKKARQKEYEERQMKRGVLKAMIGKLENPH
jgi:hypothetical protein